jgi:hypothetical protein
MAMLSNGHVWLLGILSVVSLAVIIYFGAKGSGKWKPRISGIRCLAARRGKLMNSSSRRHYTPGSAKRKAGPVSVAFPEEV